MTAMLDLLEGVSYSSSVCQLICWYPNAFVAFILVEVGLLLTCFPIIGVNYPDDEVDTHEGLF